MLQPFNGNFNRMPKLNGLTGNYDLCHMFWKPEWQGNSSHVLEDRCTNMAFQLSLLFFSLRPLLSSQLIIFFPTWQQRKNLRVQVCFPILQNCNISAAYICHWEWKYCQCTWKKCGRWETYSSYSLKRPRQQGWCITVLCPLLSRRSGRARVSD